MSTSGFSICASLPEPLPISAAVVVEVSLEFSDDISCSASLSTVQPTNHTAHAVTRCYNRVVFDPVTRLKLSMGPIRGPYSLSEH